MVVKGHRSLTTSLPRLIATYSLLLYLTLVADRKPRNLLGFLQTLASLDDFPRHAYTDAGCGPSEMMLTPLTNSNLQASTERMHGDLCCNKNFCPE